MTARLASETSCSSVAREWIASARATSSSVVGSEIPESVASRSTRRRASGLSSSTGAMLHLGLIAHRRDEDVRNLGPRELDGGPLTCAQHLAHLRPRQDHPVVVFVRAGLGRAHPLAANAEERMLEHQGSDAEL